MEKEIKKQRNKQQQEYRKQKAIQKGCKGGLYYTVKRACKHCGCTWRTACNGSCPVCVSPLRPDIKEFLS